MYFWLPLFLIQWVAAVDCKNNLEANVSLAVKSDTLVDQEKEICNLLTESMDGCKLDALICVAGGWAGGNAASKGNYHFYSEFT